MQGGATSSTTSYEPLEPKQDGVVSAQERAAGEIKETLQALLQAADSDGDEQLDPTERASMQAALTRALDSVANASGTAASQGTDLDAQAQRQVSLMLHQYATVGGTCRAPASWPCPPRCARPSTPAAATAPAP